MIRYLARRLAQAVLVLWLAWTLAFFLLWVLPSDPVSLMLSKQAADAGSTGPGNAAAAQLNHEYGFDKPLVVQYGLLLWRALHLDFGTSIQYGRPVFEVIGQAAPQTLLLGLAALLLSIPIGFGFGVLIVSVDRGWARRALSALPPLVTAFPTFWIALVLLQLFSFKLHLFPSLGNDGWRSFVLPTLTLAIPAGAVYAHVYADSLRGILREPYIDTALYAGASRWSAIRRHALRNGVIPVFTIVGMHVGEILAGAVVTETIYNRVGIGKLTQFSVNNQDIPVVQALVLVFAASFVLVNLMTDLLYSFVDPRIRLALAPRSGARQRAASRKAVSA